MKVSLAVAAVNPPPEYDRRAMTPPPTDIPAAHRWFAAKFNNRAWELVEQADRTAEETLEMLHAAHAALIHWEAVGTPVNLQRAENLLATAYLKAGQTETALQHAERGLALSEKNGEAQTAFDRASALAACAKAKNAAGYGNEALPLILEALGEADKLNDEERAVFDRLYGEGYPAA
jgi:tetratricopeptide (TPR) repeat protein